nr:hypothetical protein [Streptomyces bambusae]
MALPPEDRIPCFTDGLIEEHEARKEEFGENKLIGWVHRLGQTDRGVRAVARDLSYTQTGPRADHHRRRRPRPRRVARTRVTETRRVRPPARHAWHSHRALPWPGCWTAPVAVLTRSRHRVPPLVDALRDRFGQPRPLRPARDSPGDRTRLRRKADVRRGRHRPPPAGGPGR